MSAATVPSLVLAADRLRESRRRIERAVYWLRCAERAAAGSLARGVALQTAGMLRRAALASYGESLGLVRATGVELAHVYERGAAGFRAAVLLGERRDVWVWRGARVYPHRQSAQRAALKARKRIGSGE